MNRFYLIVCFCLSVLFFLSCERPDLTEKIESAYDYADIRQSCSLEVCFGDMIILKKMKTNNGLASKE